MNAFNVAFKDIYGSPVFFFFFNSSEGMFHLWAFGRVRVSSVSTRSQNAARENQTVLHYMQHTGKLCGHF